MKSSYGALEVRGNSICRFGIPYFPMPNTDNLQALPEDTQQIHKHRETFKKIQKFLALSFDADSIKHCKPTVV